jgi:hypothetical protein
MPSAVTRLGATARERGRRHMIRGAIEVAGPGSVVGWIYCAEISLTDQTVVAYIGDRSIGSGKIDIYRLDLHKVGLGDGMCGFNFRVRTIEGDNLGSIVVRLQKSDLFLTQPGRLIIDGSAKRDGDAA